MAFNIGGIAVDHIVMGTFENAAGDLVYTLSNLSEATISVASESKDITNARGNLVRKIYTGKTGELSATSAFIEMGIVASASGTDLEVATEDSKIQAPAIKSVVKNLATTDVTGVVDGTVRVIGIAGNGAQVEKYTLDTAAGEKVFAVADGVLTLPTKPDEKVVEFVIKYERDLTDGLKVVNVGDKFPKAGKLTLKVLAIDPCDKEGVIAAYVVCPNFQPSPDVELALQNDGESTIAYNGTLAIDQCSTNKTLYEIYLCEDDE